MAKKKRLPGKLVRLTKDERQMLTSALRIGLEDGSLYGDDSQPGKRDAVNAVAESIHAKLNS